MPSHFETVFRMFRYQQHSPDVLTDCITEISALFEINLEEAARLVHKVLDYYHFKRTEYPIELPYEVFHIVAHVTQPFRIPEMTDRLDPILEGLRPHNDLQTVLDYGGGGGKDSIVFARSGY